jgi:hypothetical protein
VNIKIIWMWFIVGAARPSALTNRFLSCIFLLIFLFSYFCSFLSFLTYTFPIGVPFLFMYLLLLRFVAAVKEKRSPRLIHFYGQSRQDAAVYTYVLHYRLYFFPCSGRRPVSVSCCL